MSGKYALEKPVGLRRLSLICLNRLNLARLFRLVSFGIDNNPPSALIRWHTVSRSTKIENLKSLAESQQQEHHHATYFDISHAVSLNSCDASAVVELDLPHTAQVCQKILDKLASLDIPHLERTI